ncbi:MAG: rRNA cytosine-C5-methyltransferase [Bacteroidaceae bacterium]
MLLPQAFIDQTTALLGEQQFTEFCKALDNDPIVSVRPNPFKDPEAKALKNYETDARVEWSSSGRYLSKRPQFTLNPLFHAGAFYVQEASSMFLEQALKHCGQPRVVLDLCAAPGGKSTLLRSLLPDETLLVCNEPIRSRALILAENIIKWGHEGCLVTSNFPRDFSKVAPIFDLVVIDAPCSGEGMFRKDNPALEMWSPSAVEQCAARQQQIINDIWPSIKQGGYIIYSTCTYNTLENEDNISYMCEQLGAEAVEIEIDPKWNILRNLSGRQNLPTYRFMPHKTRGEGFCIALVRKTSDAPNTKIKTKKKFSPLSTSNNPLTTTNMVTLSDNDTLYALRANDATTIGHIIDHLHPLTMGVALSEIKGRREIPCHQLAMSRLLDRNAFPSVELPVDKALDYLRRQTICIDAKKGYTLLTHKDVPLGFVNNLGNRSNNMYPQNWKIRH